MIEYPRMLELMDEAIAEARKCLEEDGRPHSNVAAHFHCVVIDGVFEPAAGGVLFHAASGLDATAITQVQAQVRRGLLRGFVRRGLLPADDAQAMAQWQHGGGFSLDASVRIAPPTSSVSTDIES